MHDLRLDDTHGFGSQHEDAAITGVLESSFFHDDVTPHARLQTMVMEKSGGHRRFVEVRRPLVGLRIFGNRRHVAEQAIEFGAEFVSSTFLRGDPTAVLPRRVVTHVLRV